MILTTVKMFASWGTGVSCALIANASITNQTTLPLEMAVAIAAGTLGIGLWIARSMHSIDTRLTVIESKVKEIDKLPCRNGGCDIVIKQKQQ
jgi:hypothetical protein